MIGKMTLSAAGCVVMVLLMTQGGECQSYIHTYTRHTSDFNKQQSGTSLSLLTHFLSLPTVDSWLCYSQEAGSSTVGYAFCPTKSCFSVGGGVCEYLMTRVVNEHQDEGKKSNKR